MSRWKRELIAWGSALLVLALLFSAQDVGRAMVPLVLIGVVTRVIVQMGRLGVGGAVVVWAVVSGGFVFLQYMGIANIADDIATEMVPLLLAALLALPTALFPIWPLGGTKK